jgi:ketosteroid isomerase-like protein
MDSELSKLRFNQTIEKYHRALSELNNGNAKPVLDIFSTEDDVSLANPIGPAVKGRQEVVQSAENTATAIRKSDAIDFENLINFVNCDFAYIVENEKYKTKVSGTDDFDKITLRVTSIFRLEDGGWKMIHRHADPFKAEMPVETIAER